MAEHLLSSAASAVTGELTRVLFTGLMGKLDRKKAAAADRKLRRLDMLLIKINSAVEASEKHAIGNASLVKWRDRLKAAAAEGAEVLASFRQRESEAAAAAQAQDQATGDGDDAQYQQQQNQEDPSSSSSSSTGTPSGMPQAQGIFSATKKLLLFSREEDMERLNNAVERLQDLSSDIGVFIKLLKLEILAPAPAPAPAPELRWAESSGTLKKSRSGPGDFTGTDKRSVKIISYESDRPAGQTQMDQTAEAQAAGEGSTLTLLGRLEDALATICRIVELADGRDLSDYEWLAYWASILREAKWQGCAVLGSITSSVDVDDARACDEEDSELGGFVRYMESLAGEADSFSDLACLCPSPTAL